MSRELPMLKSKFKSPLKIGWGLEGACLGATIKKKEIKISYSEGVSRITNKNYN